MLKRSSLKYWVMAVLGVLLLAQSAYLVTVKVTHLGVMLPACFGLALLALGIAQDRWAAWLDRRRWRRIAWKLLQAGFLIWLLSLIAFFWQLQRQHGQGQQGFVPQVMVVLGSSTPNAQPSPTLAERLNLALGLARQYPHAKVLVSGGVDFRQVVAEADVMAAYLKTRGLDKARILIEKQSTSTHENLVFSLRVLQVHGMAPDAAMLLVTSDFHTLRAGWIARKTGWKNVKTAGAETPLYMRYNAWMREYFACLSGWLLGEY